jgi:hypothetical protein
MTSHTVTNRPHPDLELFALKTQNIVRNIDTIDERMKTKMTKGSRPKGITYFEKLESAVLQRDQHFMYPRKDGSMFMVFLPWNATQIFLWNISVFQDIMGLNSPWNMANPTTTPTYMVPEWTQ